jgi:transposase
VSPGPGRDLLPGAGRDRVAATAGRVPAADHRLRPADAGYSGRLLVWDRNVMHLTVQIVKRSEPGFVVLPRRWVVERTFAWRSKHRRCVRDYETKPDHHEAMIYIVMIMNMSRRLARTGDW